MKRRCQRANAHDYPKYGGRGIKIHPEWNDYVAFAEWARSAGYADDLSIERADVNGDYSPDNCSWIPLKDQAKNTRRSVKVVINGEIMCIAEAARRHGLTPRKVHGRRSMGWPESRWFDPEGTRLRQRVGQ